MNNTLDEAFAFYASHIYDEEKINLLKSHNLKVAGMFPLSYGSCLVQFLQDVVVMVLLGQTFKAGRLSRPH